MEVIVNIIDEQWYASGMGIFLTVIGAVLVTFGAFHFVKAWRSSSEANQSHAASMGHQALLSVSLIAVFAGLLPLALGVVELIRG